MTLISSDTARVVMELKTADRYRQGFPCSLYDLYESVKQEVMIHFKYHPVSHETIGLLAYIDKFGGDIMNEIEKEAEHHIIKFVECTVTDRVDRAFKQAISDVVAERLSGKMTSKRASVEIYSKTMKAAMPLIEELSVDFAIFIDKTGSMMGKNINIDIKMGQSTAKITTERPNKKRGKKQNL